MSVSRLLAELEARVAHHEAQEAHHAEQEIFHREERARHAAALESTRERLAAFRAAAEAAGELVAHSLGAPTAPEDELPPGASLRPSDLAWRILKTLGPDETIGGAEMTREINRRYGRRLRRPVKERNIATALRRMAAAGYIRQIQKGRAYHEALYARWEEEGEGGGPEA
jgi:hypothetical protein